MRYKVRIMRNKIAIVINSHIVRHKVALCDIKLQFWLIDCYSEADNISQGYVLWIL